MKFYTEYHTFTNEGIKNKQCSGKFPTREAAENSGKGTIVLAYAERVFIIKGTQTKCHFFAYGLTMNDAIKRVVTSMMNFRKKNPTFPSLKQIDDMDKQMDNNWADNILSKIK